MWKNMGVYVNFTIGCGAHALNNKQSLWWRRSHLLSLHISLCTTVRAVYISFQALTVDPLSLPQQARSFRLSNCGSIVLRTDSLARCLDLDVIELDNLKSLELQAKFFSRNKMEYKELSNLTLSRVGRLTLAKDAFTNFPKVSTSLHSCIIHVCRLFPLVWHSALIPHVPSSLGVHSLDKWGRHAWGARKGTGNPHGHIHHGRQQHWDHGWSSKRSTFVVTLSVRIRLFETRPAVSKELWLTAP